MSNEILCKIVMIGDMGVGKSCLLRQFTDYKFYNNSQHTIGVAFGTKLVEITPKNSSVNCSTSPNPVKIRLHIWDTAGQERFRTIARSYYRDSVGVLLVYDITRHESFEHLKGWLEDARNLTDPNSVIILVGNKSDLEDHREVTISRAQQFAKRNDLLFIEVSAKEGKNVESTFLTLAREVYDCPDLRSQKEPEFSVPNIIYSESKSHSTSLKIGGQVSKKCGC